VSKDTAMKMRPHRSLYRILSPLAALLLLSLLLAFTGCGGAKAADISTDPTNPLAATVSISPSPASIAAGSSSTLTVSAANATAVKLTGSDGSSYTLATSGGTQAVTPTATATYTVTATGAGGNATATATVTVTALPQAPTVKITANPASIAAGSTSTLTITATNATAVTVTGSDGSSHALTTSGGTQTVTPAATTSYTATATSAAGNVSATTTVTVTAAPPAKPTVTIAAKPGSISAGSSSALTVAAANATTVTLTGSDGSSHALTTSGGTQTVTPAATTTYTAQATGAGGTVSATATVTVTKQSPATVNIVASPTSIITGAGSTLTVTATHATAVTVTGSDNSSYTFPSPTGGKHDVTPSTTTTYTAEATADGGNVSTTATVTVTSPGSTQAINHVIFMLQENHTFDNYFGMLNNYRRDHSMNTGDDGNVYRVDGIDDKLNISNKDKQGVTHSLYKFKSTCVDDMSSAWSESFADVSLGNPSASRSIKMNGYVSNADGFATSKCSGDPSICKDYTDLSGDRAMGYYDEGLLNYYYYMAAQFAVSDRWFSPIASKSNPNRIATYNGGSTGGLVNDPGYDDHVGALNLPNIFRALDDAKVSWKVYYSVTVGKCGIGDDDCGSGPANYPNSALGYIWYTHKYIYENPSKAACTGTTQPSNLFGDPYNYFCMDPNHIASINTYYTDLANGTLPSFAFIEPGYGRTDEHPGSFQPVLLGQQQMAKIINAFMASPEWKDSVFFFSYDEGGGPYDHVPPVPHHTNDKTTDSDLPNYPVDIASISVSPDSYKPCVPATLPATTHCDLKPGTPGSNSGDAAAVNGFAAQIGFRVPNIVISPFTRRHYVSHIPMDHTAVIKFIEDRFIGNGKYITARDAAQPSLLDFFDFSNPPWETPPTPPVPASNSTLGHNTCTPSSM
jgi:phospholipase C